MDLIKQFIEIVLHLDTHLVLWLAILGPWMYVLLFAIIFAETGLVVTPFLPGDSLLFAVGALTALSDGGLSLGVTLFVMILAAISGDSTNYFIGRKIGPKIFSSATSRILNKEHLMRTQKFYEKYGTLTVIIARFMPIVRTFAPFVAGIGKMKYTRFLSFSVLGSIAWVGMFILAGHYFGNLPVVKRNFHIVVFGVIFISLLPMLFSWLKLLLEKKSLKA